MNSFGQLLDPALLADAYASAPPEEKPTPEEIRHHMLKCSTPSLRCTMGKVFQLSDEAIQDYLREPYLEPAPRPILRLEDIEAKRLEQSRYAPRGLSAAEAVVVIDEIFLHWLVTAPQRLKVKPLPIVEGKAEPADWDRFRDWLKPWVSKASPSQPGNWSAAERIGKVVAWWCREVVDALYACPRLNGKNVERRKGSLQWLATPWKDEHGEVHPMRNLEMLLAGKYFVTENEQDVLDRFE